METDHVSHVQLVLQARRPLVCDSADAHPFGRRGCAALRAKRRRRVHLQRIVGERKQRQPRVPSVRRRHPAAQWVHHRVQRIACGAGIDACVITRGEAIGLAAYMRTMGLLGLACSEAVRCGKQATRHAGEHGDCRTEMAYGAVGLTATGV